MRMPVLLLLVSLACLSNQALGERPADRLPALTVGEGKVWRRSDHENRYGHYLPPWKEVLVTNVFGFKEKPAVGKHVTVVPLEVDVAPFDLRITGTRKGAACDAMDPDVWWQVDLEPVQRKELFEISSLPGRRDEYPFDVGVIYPAVKFASQITGSRLKKEMLPRGVALATVKAAIDLTNDGIPDALIVEHCCKDSQKAARECDLTCGETYRKTGGAWKLVDTSSPC